MVTTVASYATEYTQVLDPQGEPVAPLPEFAQAPETLKALYRAMVLTRQFDAKAIALQRTGKIGTFASSLGQEAVGVGVASAMRPEDVLLPSYREHGAQFVRGVTMTESLLYWGGDERGSNFAAARHDFPNCVPIGTQVCHATGAARAFQLRGEARVAVCIMGDGATSKGDFYEGINMAGVWQVPLVVVVNNNQWAISLPRHRQTAAQTLAQKALSAGIPGLQVDGNDVIAVRQAADEALDKARNGHGPALIEAITYRLGDHTTADDASRYRDNDAVKAQWVLEPVVRLRNYLVKRGLWDAAQEEAWLKHCTQAVAQAVDDYLAAPAPETAAMFEHLYAALPDTLRAQLASAQHFAPRS
ncbi:2-oxoisovalerate dehydrogenase subunit alpha [Pandoraea terrae]|uniref:Pyruvate dehydrogenase E1 component subunit alpha n=1 Tax=Pandoraea terrae TaxID=1537710 RepID=A0A5E4S598_9BURK|nr:pyruvate dehydrogenase (acetyl-transferring) E1 component subunit alpha [Pandoraea terrae]VVD70760.1 2-oxoisovalerate dehydrogenase subunit alpha [Pandoraea terrae]